LGTQRREPGEANNPEGRPHPVARRRRRARARRDGGVGARRQGRPARCQHDEARQRGGEAAERDAREAEGGDPRLGLAQINEAAADEDIDAGEAADLKEEAQDNLSTAYALSRASTVAKELGVTTTQLNTAFRAARKALIVAQIDQALKDGDIDADEAAEAKADLDDADLPGYKQSRLRFGGGGFDLGHRGP